jgi:capsular exopolysaccharide synthesis family protein
MATNIENLPLVYDLPRDIAEARPEVQTVDPSDSKTPLSHYLWVLRVQAWKISLFVLISMAVTFIVASKLQPIYESTATVNIDRQAPTTLVGDDSQKTSATPQDADQYIATQIQMIGSDAVLRPVARKFNLLEREGQLNGLSNEEARNLKNAPVVLKQLRVTRPMNTYLVTISYRSTDRDVSANVANAIARSYLEHAYRMQIDSSISAAGFMEKQLDELKAKMEKSSEALAEFEKELNVINPEEKTNITSARLLQLNTDYTTAQSDRVRKEAIFKAMNSGSLAAQQISGFGDDLQKLQEKINEARQQFVEIQASKGPNHPEYRRAQLQLSEMLAQYQATRDQIAQRIETDYKQSLSREQMLKAAVAETKAEFDKINERSFEYQRLKQDAEADKKLYEQLVTKIREASINAGFENKNIVVADFALPGARKVFPRTLLSLLLAGFLSCVLGMGTVILMDAFDTTLRDPEMISRLYNTDLIGTLPLVREPRILSLRGTASKNGSDALVPLGDGPEQAKVARPLSSFEEAVRMVRNSILLTSFDRRIRSILLTSATPGEGKTTTALYLAMANAEQGKRTLLIDADLRRPTLHQKLGISTEKGLASVVKHECLWRDVVLQVRGAENLEVMLAGPASRRAADTVGMHVADILEEAAEEYDLVIVDAPPMLGFAEPMQIATVTDGVVIVAVAGETNRKAVGAVVATLQRVKANVVGVLLNRTSKETSSYYYYNYYGYGNYGYYQGQRRG